MSPRIHRLGRLLPAVFAIVFVAACGADAPPVTPGVDAGSGTTCASNADCAGGQICRIGLCRTACAGPTECTTALPACDTTGGYCVECNLDSECGANEVCTARACEFFCRADTACAADEYCVTATGACAARECNATPDCSGGYRCDHFVCVPIDPIVCEAGTVVCSGGNTAVLTCNADGTMETTETCSTDSICVVDGTSASCALVVCTPDEIGCSDDHTAYACDATGTARVDTPCGVAEFCGAGACLPQNCVPGSVRCSVSGEREECDARGAAYVATACGTSQSCRDGACLERVCVPAAARCVPGSLTAHEVCDAEGLAYVSAPCGSTETCSAGTCLARVCTPGTAACDGTGASHVCNADGLGYGTSTSCSGGSSCTVATGLCGSWVCTPASATCVAGSNARHVCNADGLGYTDTACGASSTCSAGVCAAWTCTPGAYSCADVNTRQVCTADGLGYSGAACTGPATSGYSCMGTGTCTARACIPGSTGPVCASATARQVCDADGLAYSTVACNATESCAAGTCQTRICVPGTPRCAVGSLTAREVCAADGLSWTPTPCGSTESCSAGTCTARICTPSMPACVSSTASHTCSADGLSYGATTTCAMSTSCSAPTGLCGAWVCTPGSASCVAGNTRHVCDADGLGYTDVACGASTTCTAGLCAAWTCTPAAYSCIDVNTRRVCNADGLGYSSANCSGAATYGYSCTGTGVCTDRVCTPGTASSICASTTARQVCNTDGLGYSASSCTAGQSCSTGSCAVRCGDGIVGATEECDDGNVINGDGCSSTCTIDACAALSLPSRGVYAQVADAVPLRLASTSFTVEMWAYATDFGSLCHNVLATKRGLALGDGWFFSVRGTGCSGTSGRLYYQVSGGGDPQVISTVSAPTGRWFHAAVTFDRASAMTRLWLDGVEVGSGVTAIPNAATTALLRIGEDTGGSTYGWNGRLDNIRISNVVRYSSAFTPAQQFITDAATVALWSFDEGSGATTADRGPSGYVATLAAGATWSSVPACTHGPSDGTSCASILAAWPATPSGTYTIDPDGAGPEPTVPVFCDMTTMGGGWTVIFAPASLNYTSSSLDYTVPSFALRNGSTEAMVAYRNLDALAVATTPYRFTLPTNWRTQSPLRYANVNEAVTVTSGSGATTTTTLVYGYENWGADVGGASCPATWLPPATANLGRVCISGTVAPAYWSFADASGDYCGNSSGHWATGTCTRTTEFTIAVR